MHEPWSLIPVKELGDILKEKLFKLVPNLERHFDKHFVCPDHFRFLVSSLKNKRNLSNFVPSILKIHLSSGEVSLSLKSFCNLNNNKMGYPLKNTQWLANYLDSLWDSSPRVPPFHEKGPCKKEALLAFKRAFKCSIFPVYGLTSFPRTSYLPR